MENLIFYPQICFFSNLVKSENSKANLRVFKQKSRAMVVPSQSRGFSEEDENEHTMWHMAYELSAALSTRNVKQRSGNSNAGQVTKNIGTGVISILFPTILPRIFHSKLGAVHASRASLCSSSCVYAVAKPRHTWYNDGKDANGIDAVIIVFEVVFLAACAATEKHGELYHSRFTFMV